MIHPDHSEVLPLAPEPIRKEYGTDKTDCERNAARRLSGDLRREHPHLKAINVEDAPASNCPLHINQLKNSDFLFFLGAKPGDHKLLFSWLEPSKTRQSWEKRDKKTSTCTPCGLRSCHQFSGGLEEVFIPSKLCLNDFNQFRMFGLGDGKACPEVEKRFLLHLAANSAALDQMNGSLGFGGGAAGEGFADKHAPNFRGVETPWEPPIASIIDGMAQHRRSRQPTSTKSMPYTTGRMS